VFFFYLIEQHSKFLFHTLQVLYIYILCDSTNRTNIETFTADMLQTAWNELDYRVNVCRITKFSYIGHL